MTDFQAISIIACKNIMLERLGHPQKSESITRVSQNCTICRYHTGKQNVTFEQYSFFLS